MSAESTKKASKNRIKASKKGGRGPTWTVKERSSGVRAKHIGPRRP